MSGFSNPVVGGGGKLIRESIHSPDFVTGTTGWSVNSDGSAEFNDVTLTGGSLVVESSGQGVFVYRGTPAAGNLIVSLASADGTDAHGNAYTRGLWINGYQADSSFANQITFQPPDFGATTFDPGKISAQTDAAGRAYLAVIGPDTLAGGVASIPVVYLTGSNPADGGVSSIALDADDTQVSGTLTGPNIVGEVLVSFTSQTAATISVTFPKAFATTPKVMTNIRSGAGVTLKWGSKVISASTTGCTIEVFANDGIARNWTNVPVEWLAIGT